MKAFVTGSTGLLGNNLVQALLAQGHEVKALARSQRKAEQLLGDTATEIVLGDMDDVAAFADELEGCDVLFHGAAFFREYYQPGDHWATLKRINVDAVIEIFEAAEARGVRRAIFVSSSGTVGEGTNGTPGDETAPPPAIAADNLYFRSKVLADEAVAAWLPAASWRSSQSCPAGCTVPTTPHRPAVGRSCSTSSIASCRPSSPAPAGSWMHATWHKP